MNDILLGAAAGCAATVPMTLAMEAMHRQLPRGERYPLPPRLVTMRVAEQAGIKEQLDEEEREDLSLLAHYGMGTAMGALYGSLAQVRDGLEQWFEAGVRTPILVPSSAAGNQMKAFEELFAVFS